MVLFKQLTGIASPCRYAGLSSKGCCEDTAAASAT